MRGIAVLAVCLYHFKAPYFGRGYYGVDLFFVISGYLITTIIQDELRAGTFSFRRFYARRARRILPNLLAVLLAAGLGGLATMRAWDLMHLGRLMLATLLSAANVAMAGLPGGYFSVNNELNPLLMTWSLGIEEQFYLIWPAFLLFFWRRAPLASIATVVAMSLGLRLWQQTHAPTDAFYLLPGRAWELGLGALLAQESFRTAWRERPWLARAYAPLARGLSVRPLVAVGRISYSLYLWHWPTLVFCRWLNARNTLDTPLLNAAAAGSSLALAYLAWRFVEEPGRTIRLRTLGIGAAGVAVLGVLLVRFEGFPERLTPMQREAYADSRPPGFRCIFGDVKSGLEGSLARKCETGPSSPVRLLILGDSHADAVAPAIAAIATRRGVGSAQHVQSACRPLFARLPVDPACNRRNLALREELTHRPEFRCIVLAGKWDSVNVGTPELRTALSETLRSLRELGRGVVLIGDAPGFPFDVSLCHSRRILGGLLKRLKYGDDCEIPLADAGPDFARVNAAVIATGALFPEVTTVDLTSRICPDGLCRTAMDGAILYRDNNHLALTGATRVLRDEDLEACLK